MSKNTASTEVRELADRYRHVRSNVEGLETDRITRWDAVYSAAMVLLRAGLTVRQAGSIAGVSHGTLVKESLAWPMTFFGPEAWLATAEAIGQSGILPHVLIGRAIDAGVPKADIEALMLTIDDVDSEADAEASHGARMAALTSVCKSLIKATAAAIKAKKDAEKKKVDDTDTEPDTDTDTETEPETEPETVRDQSPQDRANALGIALAGPMAALAELMEDTPGVKPGNWDAIAYLMARAAKASKVEPLAQVV